MRLNFAFTKCCKILLSGSSLLTPHVFYLHFPSLWLEQWEAKWCTPLFLLTSSVPQALANLHCPMGPKYFLCITYFLAAAEITYHGQRNYWLVLDEKQAKEWKFGNNHKRNRTHESQSSISSNILFCPEITHKNSKPKSMVLRWVSPDAERIFFAVPNISYSHITWGTLSKTLHLSNASSSTKLFYVV